jgi:hypothetical protein
MILSPIYAADLVFVEAELAAVQAEAALLTRNEVGHDGLSAYDEPAFPLARLALPVVDWWARKRKMETESGQGESARRATARERE